MTVRAFANIAEIPAGDWQSIAEPFGLYASEGWIKSTLGVATSPTRYGVLYRDARPIAGVTTSLFPDPASVFLEGFDHFYRGDSFQISTADLFPQLWVGPQYGYENPPLVDPAAAPAERAEILGALVRHVEDEARSRGAKVAVFPFLSLPDMLELERAINRPTVTAFACCDHVLDLQPTWDAYLATLPTNRRTSVQRELRCHEEAGATVETARLSACLDDVLPLFEQNCEKYGVPFESIEGQVRALAETLDERSLVFLLRTRDGCGGFYLTFRFGDTLYGRDTGFSEDLPRTSFGYFNTVFYGPIRTLLAAGDVREIHYGIAADEAKLSRGCRPRPRLFLLWPIAQPFASAYVQQVHARSQLRLSRTVGAPKKGVAAPPRPDGIEATLAYFDERASRR